ncbi:MAG: divalent metal cation transporter [Bacteroidota bacterium]
MDGVYKRLKNWFASIAPGLFILGYVIGTGSVTTMVAAGAKYGMALTWALLLSCIFSFIVLIAVGKLTIISKNTLLTNFKLHFGKGIVLFILLSLLGSIVSSVVGITAVVSDIVAGWYGILKGYEPTNIRIYIAILLIGSLYFLFFLGHHKLFMKVIALFVAFMSVSFLMTSIIVVTDSNWTFAGMIPEIPKTGNPYLIIGGMVGTTMAAVVIVSRSIVVQEKKWSVKQLGLETRDAAISMILTFLVSAAIMASAAATLFSGQGFDVVNTMDMVNTLIPLAGQFALFLFVCGIVAAALSSLLPNFLLFPWLLCDYLDIPRKMDKTLFRIVVFFIACSGLIVPIFGGRPIPILIFSQALSPIMMPLITLLTIILLNNKKLMGINRNKWPFNFALFIAFGFTLYMCIASLTGMLGLLK